MINTYYYDIYKLTNGVLDTSSKSKIIIVTLSELKVWNTLIDVLYYLIKKKFKKKILLKLSKTNVYEIMTLCSLMQPIQ